MWAYATPLLCVRPHLFLASYVSLLGPCSQHSNLLNQARLSVLKARDDKVKRIIDDAKSLLGDITKDSTKYKKVLEDLVAQVSVAELLHAWGPIVTGLPGGPI